MGKQLHPIVELAKDAVESYVRHGRVLKSEEVADEMKAEAGVFVSIKKHGGLRGCMGTFEPTKANVAEEIVANAISSATTDPRFTPVMASELDDLEYSVDILTSPEPVDSVDQLDPEEYGVIVESGFKRGLLLPAIEGVASVGKQIEICRAKAGILNDEPIKLYRFQVRRYK